MAAGLKKNVLFGLESPSESEVEENIPEAASKPQEKEVVSLSAGEDPEDEEDFW